MALKKPLVLYSGQPAQIQAGDTLDATMAEIEGQVFTNGDAGNHVLGEVVYLSAADTVRKAKSDAPGTSRAIAFATATIVNATTGVYQTSGALGGFAGLTAGAVYYVSAGTAGAITATAPSVVGQSVIEVGVALSTTELLIDIKPPILL